MILYSVVETNDKNKIKNQLSSRSTLLSHNKLIIYTNFFGTYSESLL